MNKRTKLFIILFVAIATATKLFGQGNYHFQVSITGQGQPVLLIPGFASSGAVWDETVAHLSKNFKCYTLTMAGFAGVPAQSNPSFRRWEHSIGEFIKKENISQPIIIGHSMGGALAIALAADYPTLIKKIVVVDALPCLSALMNPSFVANEKIDCKSVAAQMEAMTKEQFRQMQKMSIPRMTLDTLRQTEILEWSMTSDRMTMGTMYCDFTNTDLRELVKDIKVPTLVLLEAEFKKMKPAIESQFSGSTAIKLLYATKGLHFVMYDDPKWYFDQLNDFL